MKISDIKKVCVAGGGLMGRQIALNAAIHGFDTYLTDSMGDVLAAVEKWSGEYLAGRVAKGKLTQEQADAAKASFHLCPELKDAAEGAQLVIEAILEDRNVKLDFYKKVGAIAPEDAILASNSSWMPSSTFIGCVSNPGRLANIHYFNPALAMKLVEVVRGEHTADDTVQTLVEFSVVNGKTPIRVNKEIEGFVVNRVLRALRDEAFYLVDEGVCTPQEVDLGVELGLNYPMGPFRLLDLTGIDLNYLSSTTRWKETGIKPNGYDIIKEKYEKHEWGRKTGKGFYDYTDKK